MSLIDFSLPLATIVRENTHEFHERVSKSPGAIALISGELERGKYVRYLMMLWHIYDVLEQALDRHSTHPALKSTYNPTLFARASCLDADISHLLQVREASWKVHPIHLQLLATMPLPLTTYVARIQELADSTDPTALLAHSYVRYLGDLSGGQVLRRTAVKVYELDDAAGLGLAYYTFKELRSSKVANQGEMKRIKDWFKEGMDMAGDEDIGVKASVLAEAITAFDLNAALFTVIESEMGKEAGESKEIPVAIEQMSQGKSYPVLQVAAVITASVCLVHLVLVNSGFMGDKGYRRLLAPEHWFGTF